MKNLSILKIIIGIFLCFISFSLFCQKDCFEPLKRGGDIARKGKDYTTAIINYTSIIDLCDLEYAPLTKNEYIKIREEIEKEHILFLKSQADSAWEISNYQLAIDIFQRAISHNYKKVPLKKKELEKIVNQIEEERFMSLKGRADNAWKNHNYRLAIYTYQSIFRICNLEKISSKESELKETVNNIEKEHFIFLKNEADSAWNIKNYQLAIDTYQSILENCNLENAFLKRNELIDITNIIKKEYQQALSKEALNAKSSKLAFHANEEKDKKAKLILAYYSKKWLLQSDTSSNASRGAFGNAVQDSFKMIYISNLSYINDATFINNDSLVMGIGKTIWSGKKKGVKKNYHHSGQILSIIPYKSGFISIANDSLVKISLKDTMLVLIGHHSTVNGSATCTKSNKILTFSDDQTAKLWNEKGQLLANLVAHKGNIHDANFSQNGAFILTRSQDQTVGLWDNRGNLIQLLTHQTFVYDAQISSDNDFIITCSADGLVHFWNNKGKKIKAVKAHNGAVFYNTIASNTDFIATAGADKMVKFWTKKGRQIKELNRKSSIRYIEFLPNGEALIIAAGNQLTIDSLNGKRQIDFPHNTTISAVELSDNGAYILTGMKDGTVKLWSINGEELMTINLSDSPIVDVQFSNSNDHILAYSQDGVVVSCPTPDYIYQKLKKDELTLSDVLKEKYGID